MPGPSTAVVALATLLVSGLEPRAAEDHVFLYDGLRRLAVVDAPTGDVVARDHHLDGDVPPVDEGAADLPRPGGAGGPGTGLERFALATDGLGTTLALLDAGGHLVERTEHGPRGLPRYSDPDLGPPRVVDVGIVSGQVRVVFTEPVAHPLTPATGDGLRTPAPLDLGRIRLDGAAPSAAWLDLEAPGHVPGTVLVIEPTQSLGPTITLELDAGLVIDLSGHPSGTSSHSVSTHAPSPSPWTPSWATRSRFGHWLGFHALLYDAEAALYLTPARALEPTTGRFLQRDPERYADSADLYALAANDPSI